MNSYLITVLSDVPCKLLNLPKIAQIPQLINPLRWIIAPAQLLADGWEAHFVAPSSSP